MSFKLKESAQIKRNIKQVLINLALRQDFNIIDAIEEASEMCESDIYHPNAAILPDWFIGMFNNPKM